MRQLPEAPPPPRDVRAMFASAERHGLSGVVLDAWRARGFDLPADLARRLEALSLARAIDHDAHLSLLGRIDARFAEASLPAAALKGPLFAERFYARPSSRATSDLDLLVREADLDRAASILADLGFVGVDGAEEPRQRREHHHLHLSHPDALPLELHFRGYAAFGRVLPSEPLVAGRRPAPVAGMSAVGVLGPEDELVFLAVHAGAHRFVRLGWLYDIDLLTRRMSDAELREAKERARVWGFGRVLGFAGALLTEVLGAPAARLSALGSGDVGAVRAAIARWTVGEPRRPIVRASTRLAYTVALCDDRRAAVRYTMRASGAHARRMLSGRT
ncbi:MAG: nucleotidyltransferase family protein [Labilithrix sp.]|nr:nucleotidyltransferase family protein [Labilithrix sp.]